VIALKQNHPLNVLWPPALLALALSGCGHMAGFSAVTPISVTLALTTVQVSQSGTPVVVPISIVSTSETATVSVTNLPTGLQETYASSDTNPSGSLKFTADRSTPLGSYQPGILVVSAGQTAGTTFTLVVAAK
jgi:hypothetical protein